MKFTINGVVASIGETQAISPTFNKRTVRLDCTMPNAQYLDFVEVEFTQTNTPLLDAVNVGDTVEVDFAPQTRQGKNDPNKWWTSLHGFAIRVTQAASTGGSGGSNANKRKVAEAYKANYGDSKEAMVAWVKANNPNGDWSDEMTAKLVAALSAPVAADEEMPF